MNRVTLPIDDLIPEILSVLGTHRSMVLSAAPGAGKTTRVPPALMKVTSKQVWVLEPRRIAAVSAAHRIAEEQGWELGKEVGYNVRFDNRSSKNTRLLFLTEALLMRKMISDPSLSEVGCIVLDEFHERSIHIDLALGALRELQELARPDLKIVVMSATLDARPLASYLGDVPVLESSGKVHPLEIYYEDKPFSLRTDGAFIERIGRLIQKASVEKSGDILCFLPGRGEIERVRRYLEDWGLSKNTLILPLHGQLSLQEQRAAILPSSGQRKVILATNVAESSLTVSGVRIVVDSGLNRTQLLNSKTGLESLELAKISMASATQRAGRAAREEAGTVYRAWSVFDERGLLDFELAEIYRKDLSESLLLLAGIGVTHPENFLWFEPPSSRSLMQAQSFLKNLDAIDSEGHLTKTGERLRDLPVHPRLGKLLIEGQKRGFPRFAADLAALLSEGKSAFSGASSGAENDLYIRLEDWKRNSDRHRQLNRAAQQLREMLRLPENQKEKECTEIEFASLILSVFSDRLCRRRRRLEPEAKMVGGRGVRLHQDSSVRMSEFFVALEIAEGREASEALVFQAIGIPEEIIEKEIVPKAQVQLTLEWDKEKERFWAVEFKEFQGLSVSNEHRRPARPEEIEGRLVDVLMARWERLLESNTDLGHWFSRLKALEKFNENFAVLSMDQIRESLEAASYGESSLAKVEEKDLVFHFENQLSMDHKKALEREAPSFWIVPTGNKMKIQYSEEQGAFVEVRLQELFGLERAPVVAGQSLTLFLLAPNYRPVQVTRDLSSFWKNGYVEVRKEMRARYPKHSWPENPLMAAPQSKGRSTKS